MSERRMARRTHAAERGFSLIEVLVAVAIIGIVSAIAIPNFRRALNKTQRQAAVESAFVLQGAIEDYMAMNDSPPLWMNNVSLDTLVDEGTLNEREAATIVANFEGERLFWYWGWDDPFGDWGYMYSIGFQPKGETDGWCALASDWSGCWCPEEGWLELGS